LASLFASPACDCGQPPPDPPGNFDGGLIVLDSGEPPVQGDAGEPPPPSDAGFDAGPQGPTPESTARELCLAYQRGLRNLDLQIAQALPPARCSNEDPIEDVGADEDLPLGTCGFQDPMYALFLRATTGGRVAFDLERVQGCLERGRLIRGSFDTHGAAIGRLRALEGLPEDPDCAAAVTPLVSEVAAPCLQAWDCAAPLRCESNPLDSGELRCFPGAVEGERCLTSTPSGSASLRSCEDGLACVLGLCTPYLSVGQDCVADGVPCDTGLVCGPDAICALPAIEGSSCFADEHCAEPLICDVDSCQPPEPAALDGESCEDGEPCASPCSVCRPRADGSRVCLDRAAAGGLCDADDHCRAGLFCDVALSRCLRLAEIGEPCADQPCEAGLVCSADEPPEPPPPPDAGVADAGPPPPTPDAGPPVAVCQRKPIVGEGCVRGGLFDCGVGACVGGACVEGVFDDPCLVDGDCADGALCVASVCTRAPRLNAPCTADGRCESGLLCRDDRCLGLPGAGETCTADNRCDDDAFCGEATEDAGPVSCEAKRSPGDPCTDDGQCRSGACLDVGSCATEAASCYTTQETFAQLIGLALLLPFLARLRRRRD
jgi:hypothetical protein